MKKFKFLFFIVITLLATLHNIENVHALRGDSHKVEQDKVWKITFNTSLAADTIHKKNIFVIDEDHNILPNVKVSLDPNNKRVVTVDNLDLYEKGKYYELFISHLVESKAGNQLEDYVTMDFRIKSEKDEQAEQVVNEVIKERMQSEDSDVEKMLKVTQFVAENTEYDNNARPDGYLVTKADPQSAYGSLVKGLAISEGYAKATKLFLDTLGYENQIVTGKKEYIWGTRTRYWNLVKLGDGNWYHLSSMGNDGRNGFSLGVFLVTDDKMREYKYSWDEESYPKTPVEYNFEQFKEFQQNNKVWYSLRHDWKSETLYIHKNDRNTGESNLFKRKLGESETTHLMECNNGGCGSFLLSEDANWIYIYNTIDHINGIYKMRTDGSEVTLLKEAFSVNDMSLESEWLTFTEWDSDSDKDVEGRINITE